MVGHIDIGTGMDVRVSAVADVSMVVRMHMCRFVCGCEMGFDECVFVGVTVSVDVGVGAFGWFYGVRCGRGIGCECGWLVGGLFSCLVVWLLEVPVLATYMVISGGNYLRMVFG